MSLYKSVKLFAFGMLIFCAASFVKANAVPVSLTVNTATDNPNLYPGGQTDSSGSTSGNLPYCINYILNQQAQGIIENYDVIFAPGIEFSSKDSKKIHFSKQMEFKQEVYYRKLRYRRFIYPPVRCDIAERKFPQLQHHRW